MKKRYVIFLLILFVTVPLFACYKKDGTQNQGSGPNASYLDHAPYLVMINGAWYDGSDIQRHRLSIADEDIVGYISSKVAHNKVPMENDQSNFLEVGTPYALYEHEEFGLIYVYKVGYYWYYLTPYVR